MLQRAVNLANLLIAVLAAGGVPQSATTQIFQKIQALLNVVAGLQAPTTIETTIADAHQLVDALVAQGILPATNPTVVAVTKFASFESDVMSGQVGVVGTFYLEGVHCVDAAFRADSEWGKQLGLS